MRDGILRYGEPLDEAELETFLEQARSSAYSWRNEILENRRECYRFYGGESLTTDEADFVRKQSGTTVSPVISVNLSAGTVNAVLGQERAQEKEVKVLGYATDTADVVGDWLTKIHRAIYRRGSLDKEEAQALFDLVVGGDGATETFMDVSRRPALPVTRHIQPWEVFADPDATRPCYEDAGFIFRERRFTVEQAQARWPDHAEELERLLRSNQIGTDMRPRLGEGNSNRAGSPSRRSNVKVIDFSYCRYVPKVEYEDPEEGIKRVTRDEYDRRKEEVLGAYAEQVRSQLEEHEMQISAATMAGALPPPIPDPPPEPAMPILAEYPGKCWYRAHYLASGRSSKVGEMGKPVKGFRGLVLDHKKIPIELAPIQVATGLAKKHFDEERISYFGLMSLVMDLQRYLSKSLALYIEILARGSKGGGWLGPGAIPDGENASEWIRRQSKPGNWDQVGDLEQIKEKSVQSTPVGMERVFDMLAGLFPVVTGVTDWVKGTASTERSNVLISNLQQQAIQMLEPLMRQFDTLRKNNARLRLEMALLHLDDDLLNEMVGEVKEEGKGITWDEQPGPDGMPQRVELATPAQILRGVDINDLNFDVQIGSSSLFAKSQLWMVLEQGVMKALLDAMNQAGVSARPLLKAMIRSLPLPGSQAVQIAKETEEEMEQAELMQTVDGLVQATLAQGPEGASQVINAVITAIQQSAPPQSEAQPS